MIEAYTHDQKRGIEVTPSEDVTGLTILAKVYQEDGEDIEFKGLANTVKPDPETASAKLTVQNDTVLVVDIVVTVSAKMRYSELYTQILQQTVSAPASATTDLTIDFDLLDYDDVKLETSGWVNNVFLVSSEILKSQFTSLVGLVVGGGANEKIVIPCDFRNFSAGEYTMVIVAEGYGVIGKDILVVYGPDGYSDESSDS